jgi:serine/threonine protein kinase
MSDRYETDNEIKILKGLKNKSPNIIEYFDDFTFVLFRCIITEYCPNGDLDALIKNKKQNREKIQIDLIHLWALNISNGLVFLHNIDIIHRDIKPG